MTMPLSGPKFSVLTPVFRPKSEHLVACIDSVLRQPFDDFEFILVDDGSADESISRILNSASEADSRVKVASHARNLGIAAASQTALGLATGEFVVLLDHDDLLVRTALQRANDVLAANPDVDYLYSDEDKIDEFGLFREPYFKPGWSPARFEQVMYTCHLSVIRRKLALEVGGFDLASSGAQDWDLVFRVTEFARRIAHVPEILYHWRIHPESTSSNLSAKPYAAQAAKAAIERHLMRQGVAGEVLPHPAVPGAWRVRRKPSSDSLVSVVLPTMGASAFVQGRQLTLVEEFLRSLNSSSYRHIEVVLVADWRMHESLIDRLKSICEFSVITVRYEHGPSGFNFSEAVNLGALHARGAFLLFANDDLQLIDSESVGEMLAECLPDVGCVGAKLLFEDNTIQHAGVTFGAHGLGPHHMHYGKPAQSNACFQDLHLVREVSCVTAACLMVSRERFFAVGGFSPQYPNNFNDVDFCLKLRSLGLRVIWTPYSLWYHFESKSRENTVRQSEVELLVTHWGSRLWLDPYGNPNWADAQCLPRPDWPKFTRQWPEPVTPDSIWDEAGYLEENPDLGSACLDADSGFDPRMHFFTHAFLEGRRYRRVIAREPEDQNAFELVPATASGFDRQGYLMANPDLQALQRMDPTWDALDHLIAHGLTEGRLQYRTGA